MRVEMRLLATAAAACALAAAACAWIATAHARSEASPAVTTYRGGYLTFVHPSTWKPYMFPGGASPHSTPLLDLSAQSARNPCKSDGFATMCGWPVDRLSARGVLVVFENRGFPGWTLRSAPGRPLRVGGRPARRTATKPGPCSAIGGD